MLEGDTSCVIDKSPVNNCKTGNRKSDATEMLIKKAHHRTRAWAMMGLDATYIPNG
jgi:hypothetical protein